MLEPSVLKEMLKKLGWRDGFQIPVANEENKALEAEVARLTLTKLQARTDSENVAKKCDALSRHLKHVTQECEQVQKLISAHKVQLDSENHQVMVKTAEKTRIVNDIRDIIRKKKISDQKNLEKKTELTRCMEKIDKIKKETFWDEEALKAWEESLKKRDQDNDILKKFSKEDEKKLLELEAKRASLQMEYLQRQKTVEKMVNDLTNYESVLERTGRTIKSQIAERDSLVSQWKDTVKILHQRDQTISLAQDRVLEIVETIQRAEESLKTEENLRNIERANNKEIERELEDLNVQFSRFQRDYGKVTQDVLLLNSELNSIKRQVTKSANQLENERCRARTLKKELETRRTEIDRLDKRVDQVKEKFEALDKTNMNIADRSKQIEKLINYEEKQHHVHLSDSDRLSGSVFRVQTKLAEQVELASTREMEITNLASMIDNLQRIAKESMINVEKKKEAMYNLEFRIDQLEEKISMLEKQQASDDGQEMYAKIRELEKCYCDHNETKNLLQDQITRIQDEMRRLTSAITGDEEILKVLYNKLHNEKLDYEGGVKLLAMVKYESQERQVEENLLILKLKQFDQITKKEENEIYNLQKMKMNLERAMRERELEVNSKKDLLQVQKRNLDEDRGRLKSDLKYRQMKIDQLQGKYHAATMTLGIGEEGQPLTVTHFKLKAAQDKYFMKQRGDYLDGKIRLIESEIVAMENTLKVVNLTNAAYRKSLSEVDDDDKEVQLMESLKKKFVDDTDQLRILKKDLNDRKQELKDLAREMEELKDHRKELENSLSGLESEFNKMERDLQDKLEKVKRTDYLIKKVEVKIDPEMMAKYDRDFEVQQLVEINRSGLQKLCQIAETFCDFKPALRSLAKEYNVKLLDIKTLPMRLSEISLTSSDFMSNLSSDLKSSSSESERKLSSKSSQQENKTRGSCHCSSTSSSVSMASVVLSFNNGKK